MDIFEIIKNRRSIRKFKKKNVPQNVIDMIVEAGTWAPSGMNNQPWKFAIIQDHSLKQEISRLTHYGRIVRDADSLIAVFLDNSLTYDRTKDVQAMGACIQNMLLRVHALGLGAVWLGEILKNGERIRELTGGSRELELMAVIALGYPAEKGGKGSRRHYSETIFFRK